MPNPYHYRARIDRLWRRSEPHNPGYIRLKALNAIVRELFAPNERARLNHEMYLATDPYDVARHLLRDLHDNTSLSPSPPASSGGRCHGVACPALDAGTEGGSPQGEDSPEEDDDPL